MQKGICFPPTSDQIPQTSNYIHWSKWESHMAYTCVKYTPLPLVWCPPLAITCTAAEGIMHRNPANGKKACVSLLHIFIT